MPVCVTTKLGDVEVISFYLYKAQSFLLGAAKDLSKQ